MTFYQRFCAALEGERAVLPEGYRLIIRLETEDGTGYFKTNAASAVKAAAFDMGDAFEPSSPPGPEGDGCFMATEHHRHRYTWWDSYERGGGYVCGTTCVEQLRHWFRFKYSHALTKAGTGIALYRVRAQWVCVGQHQCVFRKPKATRVWWGTP